MRRQVPIGPYTVDFYIHEALLVIELDGGQHACDAEDKRDAARDATMKAMGIDVMRIRNRELAEGFDYVLGAILERAQQRIAYFAKFPSPARLRLADLSQGRGGRATRDRSKA